MIHRLLSTLLALLMLTPGDVCACDGGPRVCPDHPTAPVPAEPVGCAACRGGHTHEYQQAVAPVAAAHHRCPDPLPHQHGCPAATPVPPADLTAADDGIADTALAATPLPPDLFAWVAPAAVAPAPPRPAATPLYLAHLALLI